MIPIDTLKVGDIVLYKRKKKIAVWEINKIAPSGNYLEIENDKWNARWAYRGDILEILESEISISITTVSERPPVIDSKFK